MTKFLYNDSKVYTLLFKGGSLEIKPRKYISVTPQDIGTGIFTQAIMSKQLLEYDREEDIPAYAEDNSGIVVINTTPVVVGLTAEELKAELDAKNKSKQSVADEPVIPVTQPMAAHINYGYSPPEKAEPVQAPEASVEDSADKESSQDGEQEKVETGDKAVAEDVEQAAQPVKNKRQAKNKPTA